jgi:two-component system OmpR family response regulator
MRILVVEDQIQLQQSLARALRDEHYAVDVASDGEEGLFKAENYAYDAIVLDVMLPIIDGWEVLRRLRTSSKTPVLMLTARDSTDDRVRGLDTGADDYLTKPFELPELFARLRSLIRRASGEATTAVEIGGFVVDFNAKKVSSGGEAVAITAREFSLIEYLARHCGRVISRTVLYEHLFDEEDATLSNLLDVHVSRIRRKLGKEFISTHRGQGYSIG